MGKVQKIAAALMVAATMVLVQGIARAEDRRIAVVSVSDVFAQYQRVKAVQDKLASEYKPKQDELQKKEREVKQHKERIEVDLRPKNDPALFREKIALEQEIFDLQSEYDKLTEEVEKRRKTEMQAILTEIKRAISDIGKGDKYDLVLRAPEYGIDFDPVKAGQPRTGDEAVTAAELVRRFRDNPVLYYAPDTDITQKVITKLNADYKPAAAAK
ncbi:MAG TPA: OmpH family outer membrane protein [Planctomycetota bacterium]|nr:OmpH family outer membrane protein [Planctomycetota bacterium]